MVEQYGCQNISITDIIHKKVEAVAPERVVTASV